MTSCPPARLAALLAALAPFSLPAAGRAADPLPLGRAIDVALAGDAPYADFVFEASGPGILTVAVRMPAAGAGNDTILVFADEATAEEASSAEDLMLMAYADGATYADGDHGGIPTAEQMAAPVPAAGRYVVRVASMEPGTARLIAGFVPFPEAAGTPIDLPEPVRLEPGVPQMVDVGPERPFVFEVHPDEDGLLGAMTRGAGDVALSVWTAAGDDGALREILATDADHGGNGASESLVVEVEAGRAVQIRIEALEPSRCVTFAQLFPADPALAKLAAEAAKGPPHPLVGEPLPDLGLSGLDGDPVRLAAIEERVVVLDIWATWCPPCVRALPELQKVHDWAREGGLPVAIRAINTGEEVAPVRAFLAQRGLSLPVLMDPDGAAARAFRAEAIPTTVIAANGRIESVFSGLMPDHAEHIRTIVESLLED